MNSDVTKTFRMLTFEDIINAPEPGIEERMARLTHWRLNRSELTLSTRAGGYTYEIDLEQLTTSAAALDVIAQIASKCWQANMPEVVGELVMAINWCIDVQANLCSFGKERGPIVVSKLMRAKS